MLYKHKYHQYKAKNINEVHREEMSGINNRIAVCITKVFGSMQMLYLLIVWMIFWMILSSAGIFFFRDDPYPFAFLLFLSNLIQLWALPVLAVSQNVLSRKSELQADELFHVTQKSFQDIEEIAQHLEAQDVELLRQTSMLLELIDNHASEVTTC